MAAGKLDHANTDQNQQDETRLNETEVVLQGKIPAILYPALCI